MGSVVGPSGEWLLRKPFDVRHAVECMKLYWMCDSNGEAVGIPIPAGNNPQESWMESCRMGNGKTYPPIKRSVYYWPGEKGKSSTQKVL